MSSAFIEATVDDFLAAHSPKRAKDQSGNATRTIRGPHNPPSSPCIATPVVTISLICAGGVRSWSLWLRRGERRRTEEFHPSIFLGGCLHPSEVDGTVDPGIRGRL
jgi:hypothetical protein